MEKRPLSISTIASLLITMGVSFLISLAITIDSPRVHDVMSKYPLPVPILYAINVLGALVMITSGIGMLKACNWARWLYVIWTFSRFLLEVAISPMKRALMIPSWVLFLVTVFFLFRPKANEFFASAKKPEKA